MHDFAVFAIHVGFLLQPSSDVLPFFDSLASELSIIPDMFSLQLCGATSSDNESSNVMDGLLVYNQHLIIGLLVMNYYYYYYYYYAAFNAPCVGHKADESQFNSDFKLINA